MSKNKKRTLIATDRLNILQAGLVAAVIALSYAPVTKALTADIGSQGGTAIHITTNTVMPLPDDGIIHTDSFTVDAGATLTFSYTAWMHPGVVILSTGDVNINGTIDVSGQDAVGTIGGAPGPGGGRGGSGTTYASVSYNTGVQPMSFYLLANGLRFPGGFGGDGGKASSSTGTCTGPGGGGGGGSIYIASHTGIYAGAGAKILARGGAVASNGCAATYQDPGQAGSVRLVGPTINAGGLTIEAQYARVGAVDLAGTPQFADVSTNSDTGDLYLHGALPKWPAAMPTVTITHIDGVEVTPDTMHTLSSNKNTVQVTTQVEGCTRPTLTAYIVFHYQNVSNPSSTTVSNPTGSDTVTVNIDPDLVDGHSTMIYAYLECY